MNYYKRQMDRELRRQVIHVYKGMRLVLTSLFPRPAQLADTSTDLLEMGKSYPLGYAYFRPRLHQAFASKAHLTNQEDIRQAIKQAEYVRKEMEALSVN